MAQKTEHPAGLNKWGPLRVSNVLRPDNRVAEPWIGWGPFAGCVVFCGCQACREAHLLRAGRGLFPGTAGVAGVRVYLWARVRWVFGSSGVGVFCECPDLLCGAYSCWGQDPVVWCVFCARFGAGGVACSVFRLRIFLFVWRGYFPLV